MDVILSESVLVFLLLTDYSTLNRHLCSKQLILSACELQKKASLYTNGNVGPQ